MRLNQVTVEILRSVPLSAHLFIIAQFATSELPIGYASVVS